MPSAFSVLLEVLKRFCQIEGDYPIESVFHDYAGVSGVALSVPTVLGAAGVDVVIEVPITPTKNSSLKLWLRLSLGEVLGGVGFS
jgi:L-lactate dehydrogenase